MKNDRRWVFIACFILAGAYCLGVKAQPYRGKKVLFLNSYHKGYAWSDGEQEGFMRVLANTGIKAEVVYLDSRNNPAEESKKQAARIAKYRIEVFQPDVLIAADDTAFKYVVMPYYRDADLPVVFCGINWDVSVYGGPYRNTTGMLEIGLVEGIYKHLKNFTSGNRVGFLSADVMSAHKNALYHSRNLGEAVIVEAYTKSFQGWKEKYLNLQEEADMVILTDPTGIKDWDEREAAVFALENMKVPTGTETAAMMPFALIGLIKIPQEQGEYAGRCVLRILDGQAPWRIPVVVNKKGDLMVNLRVADKLDIILTPAILRNAKKIYGIEEGYD